MTGDEKEGDLAPDLQVEELLGLKDLGPGLVIGNVPILEIECKFLICSKIVISVNIINVPFKSYFLSIARSFSIKLDFKNEIFLVIMDKLLLFVSVEQKSFKLFSFHVISF